MQHEIRLSEGWEIRREGSPDWKPVAVPGCWEAQGYPKDDAGPYWYRRRLRIPPEWGGSRRWLRFDGASYHGQVTLNGKDIGSHTGTWDRFRLEITDHIQPGEEGELLVRIEKPASLTHGPNSAYAPGRFPLRQTLSGFLPYVWGHAFGGLWQPVWLEATGQRTFNDLFIQGDPDGQVRVRVACSAPGLVRLVIFDSQGAILWEGENHAEARRRKKGEGHASDFRVNFQVRLPNPWAWSPEGPNLYNAQLELPDASGKTTSAHVRFGLRRFGAKGSTFFINNRPVYPRWILSWGWIPGRLCPAPEPERIRSDLLHLKSMGYNGVKLCLWCPPQAYFDLADELGMLIWLELPLWMPDPAGNFEYQIFREYEQMVIQARNHPSVVIYTLGCELNQAIPEHLLEQLYHQVKTLSGNAMVRDNSGSGEAYGGWLDEWADFYDHHFYCDLQFLRSLLGEFTPGWRSPKPWVMGEFGDYDTLRNLPELSHLEGDQPAWWMQPGERVNPQGARWEHRLPTHIPLLQQANLWDRLEDLRQASYRQGMLHRKYTIETVRLDPALSGYVITGETDTPVSTAGMWDELGRLKYPADEFRNFNQDTVLLLGWDRHRIWKSGSDRISPGDRWNYTSGASFRASLVVSHYGHERGVGFLDWAVSIPGGTPLADGQFKMACEPGSLQSAGVIQFQVPQVPKAGQAILQACLTLGETRIENRWPVWFYPGNPWQDVRPFTLSDPLGILADLERIQAPLTPGSLQAGSVAVCTAWAPEVHRFVEAGGRVILLQQKGVTPAPLSVMEVPFWREAFKLIEPHPAWGNFPHSDDPGLQLYALATDCALDASACGRPFRPILRRLDARGMTLLEYAVDIEWGRGRLLATTLRLHGGLGDQPAGISRSPAAQSLLAEFLKHLQAV